MIVKLLTEHHLEFLSLKGRCTGWSESTHVKMSHCWKSHAMAQSYKEQRLWQDFSAAQARPGFGYLIASRIKT